MSVFGLRTVAQQVSPSAIAPPMPGALGGSFRSLVSSAITGGGRKALTPISFGAPPVVRFAAEGSSPDRIKRGGYLSNVLELYDLDGTLTTPSFEAAEGKAYLEAVVRFVIERIPTFRGHEEGMLAGLLKTIMEDVYPQRHHAWAQFPTAQGKMMNVCPSVDHYLLTQLGVRLYLEGRIPVVGETSDSASQIGTFFGSATWANEMYGAASHASAPFARMDDDARGVLEDRLRKNALSAIFTNSSVAKARAVAIQAGFERYLVEEKLERGKLALIGNARKAVIDEEWSETEKPARTRWGDQVNVSQFFGEGMIVDLRRRAYYERIAALMTLSGAHSVWLAGDMAVLELLPMANWLAFNPTVIMRQTPMSAPEEIAVVQQLIGARVVSSLTDAVVDLG